VRCFVAPLLHLDNGFDLRPAVSEDAVLIADWMKRSHILPWWEQDWPVSRWEQELKRLSDGEHTLPCMTVFEGVDLAYVELYRVRHDRLAEYYAWQEHDWGLHLAIGDTSFIGRGVGRKLIRSLADALLRADPLCDRVVAEPAILNVPSVRAFAAAGFVGQEELELPEKRAQLMVFGREA
jgi:RimJ/RimL family protein N-acetyltransferase